MPIEFIGMIRTDNVSELDAAEASTAGAAIDRDFVAKFSRAHEDGGFDRVLIGAYSTGPDGWEIASYAATQTDRLGFLIAHRPGFVAPSLAARKAVTLDHLSHGRIALHIVTGGSDADQQRDGDWLAKDDRYARTDEYLDILTRIWTSDAPFDHDGRFYQLKGAYSDVKPYQKPLIPLYFGGASGPAVAVGAKHADVYALWGEPIAAVKERIAAVRAAAPPGRQLRFSLSLRLILGETEADAWATAHEYLERIVGQRGGARVAAQSSRGEAVGSQRLREFAAQQEVFDRRLWMPIAAATGAGGNTTALVGTPVQVAESLLDYYDAGITTILIRGFRPLEDCITYGRSVLPLVRAAVARRDRAATADSAGPETFRPVNDVPR